MSSTSLQKFKPGLHNVSITNDVIIREFNVLSGGKSPTAAEAESEGMWVSTGQNALCEELGSLLAEKRL